MSTRRPGRPGPRPTSTLTGPPPDPAPSPGLWAVVPNEPAPPPRRTLAVRLQSLALLAVALLAIVGAVLLEAQRPLPDLHVGPLPVTTGPAPEGGQQADAGTGAAFGYVNPPPQAPPVGSYVRAEVLPDGSVDVHEWITSASVLDRVVLAPRLPPGVDVQATDVRLAADLFTVTEGGTVGARPRIFPLHAPAYRLHLAYLLRGEAATRGRGAQDLVLPTALDVRFADRSGPARVDVVGSDVVSLVCSNGPDTAGQPCGEATGDGWSVQSDDSEVWVKAVVRLH